MSLKILMLTFAIQISAVDSDRQRAYVDKWSAASDQYVDCVFDATNKFAVLRAEPAGDIVDAAMASCTKEEDNLQFSIAEWYSANGMGEMANQAMRDYKATIRGRLIEELLKVRLKGSGNRR